jgi:nicotinamide-nucleotide amidase
MSLFPADSLDDARTLIETLTRRQLRLVTAESCTGGLIAALLTEIAGASQVFVGGFVVYADNAKSAWAGVDPVLIMSHGAVSSEVAAALAEGALASSTADIAIAVTGIAGPDGGSDRKPVGLVHFGCATRHGEVTTRERRYGSIGRSAIRMAAVADAMHLVRQAAENLEADSGAT